LKKADMQSAALLCRRVRGFSSAGYPVAPLFRLGAARCIVSDGGGSGDRRLCHRPLGLFGPVGIGADCERRRGGPELRFVPPSRATLETAMNHPTCNGFIYSMSPSGGTSTA
jgi:hypothetical protein